MSRRPPVSDDVEVMATLHSATTNILVCLAKALENAGTLRADEFEQIVRIMAVRTEREKSPAVAALMLDFADQLSRTPPTKN